MKKSLLSMLLLSMILLSVTATMADLNYDEEFYRASTLRGNEAVRGTDHLIKNATEVLHKENMRTHAELEQLRRQIEELKKAIKEVKDIVEGGG